MFMGFLAKGGGGVFGSRGGMSFERSARVRVAAVDAVPSETPTMKPITTLMIFYD
jgi:hypothetical protein